MYLLCPSTTNSRERHLLVRFPEPLFGLSKKGNLTRHLLPSGACFNLARLGQHHNETSAWHWTTCYHYWSCCQDANSRPTPNCTKSLPLFLLVCSGQRAFKERENMGCVKPTEFRSTQVLNHCNRSERERHCDTKPQVLYLLLGYFLTKRDNYPGRRTSWLILLYKSIWKNDSVVGWMGGFLWKMADRALTGRRNNIVLVPLFIALFNRKTSNLLPHKM